MSRDQKARPLSIRVRMSREELALAHQAAARDERSLSDFVRVAVRGRVNRLLRASETREERTLEEAGGGP